MERGCGLTLAVCLWAFCWMAGVASGQGPAGLLGWDGRGNAARADNLGTIDETALTFTDLGGLGHPPGIVSEIELAGGVVYATNTGQNNQIFVLDAATGDLIETVTLTNTDGVFSFTFAAFTALETLRTGLHGILSFEGGRGGSGGSALARIDVGTGVVTVIGATGLPSAIGGLANDDRGLVASSAGGTDAGLYEIDPASGAATLIAPLVGIGGSPISLTGLEYGLDGVLYGLGRARQGGGSVNNELFAIDRETGLATSLGVLTGTVSFTGLSGITSAFMPPDPADVNGDGVVNVSDLFAFITLFSLRLAGSDFDGNGVVNVSDFFAYLGVFTTAP